MNLPASQDPESDLPATAAEPTAARTNLHPDPITGEPDAHPVGVGVGAFSAGAAGAAVGGLAAGPVGLLIGAAIGAIAGGLAGKEVAESPEISPTSEEGAALDEFDQPATDTVTKDTAPPDGISERTNPAADDFFTGGSGSEGETALDDFDRPHRLAPVAAHYDLTHDDENPLPTASSGVITPDESSIFADSTTGESSILAESPFPAARAVSPGDHFATVTDEPFTRDTTPDSEQTIRTSAYFRYVDRQTTGQDGSEFNDWIEAEKEVASR